MLNILILAMALVPAPQRAFLWEYPTADLATGEVSRFELKVDNGEWTDVGRLASEDQVGAEKGSVIYTATIPALKLGAHTAQLRACNVAECGEPATANFTVSIKPAPPVNFRIGGER